MPFRTHASNLADAFGMEWISADQYKKDLHKRGVVVSNYYATYMAGGEAYKHASWAILLIDAGKPWSAVAYKIKGTVSRAKELALAARTHWGPIKMAEMLDKHRGDLEIVHILARANKGET